jgi:hypothetical protein
MLKLTNEMRANPTVSGTKHEGFMLVIMYAYAEGQLLVQVLMMGISYHTTPMLDLRSLLQLLMRKDLDCSSELS